MNEVACNSRSCNSRLRSLTATQLVGQHGSARFISSFLVGTAAPKGDLSSEACSYLDVYFSKFSAYRKAKMRFALTKSARLALSCPRASVHESHCLRGRF